MAQVIRCATTQPAICSRPEGDGSRNRYTFENISASVGISEADNAWLMVCSRLVSYIRGVRGEQCPKKTSDRYLGANLSTYMRRYSDDSTIDRICVPLDSHVVFDDAYSSLVGLFFLLLTPVEPTLYACTVPLMESFVIDSPSDIRQGAGRTRVKCRFNNEVQLREWLGGAFLSGSIGLVRGLIAGFGLVFERWNRTRRVEAFGRRCVYGHTVKQHAFTPATRVHWRAARWRRSLRRGMMLARA
jgi:hypothetical protein